MKNFLFNGTWGYMPKCVFWFLAGWIICAIIEHYFNGGGNTGHVLPISWIIGIVGTIMAGYSLWLTLKSEN